MPDGTEIRNAAKRTAPYAGAITVLVTSTGAGSIDLSTIGLQQPIADNQGAPTLDGGGQTGPGPDIVAPVQSSRNVDQQGLLGRYVYLRAVTSTVGFICGPTQALVTSANAPVLATTGSNTAGCCDRLIPEEWQEMWISGSTRWLGYVATGAGTLIIRASSVGGQG
jgi:hypothetical protein